MAPPARSPWVSVAAVAAVAMALRAAAFSGTELYADEAYYWLWSLRPAGGYFDHPPLVAWLIGATAPLIPGEVGVRLPFLLAGGLAVVFAALLARELSPDDRVPLLAALLAASAPLLNLLGALALPDAPLAAAYTAALWLLARARGWRWVWAGLAVGVALLAKYTAALLAPGLLLLVVWDPELRRALRTRWPWLGALAALAVFAPCLAWNAGHGWASIRFQLGHGFARAGGPGPVLTFLGGQLAAAGPVALLLGVAYLARARTSAARRVAAGALLPLVVTAWSALGGRAEVNWPALAYPALAAGAAAWLGGHGAAGAPRRWALPGALVGASAAVAVLLLAVFAVEQRQPRWLRGTPAVERFHGWRATAEQARHLIDDACGRAACDAGQPFLVPASYQLAAELAFYGGFRRLGPALERPSQLDVWALRPGQGEAVLLVGLEPVGPALRARVRADGEGPTERAVITYQGTRLRELIVTPFTRQAAEARRR